VSAPSAAGIADRAVVEERGLELVEEQVVISRRTVPGQTVRVSTTSRSRAHVIDEPIIRETVEVERVAIGRIVTATPDIRQEGDVTILPVMEEVLVLERRLVLKEEVRIKRIRTIGAHRETVQPREQVATVMRFDPEQAALGNRPNIPPSINEDREMP
jgi:stress response protein YsnF